MQRQYRDVELVAVGVFEREELRRPVADIERLQAEVASDAVILVYHRIADLQFREAADDRFRFALSAQAPAALRGALAVKLGLGDDGDFRFPQQQSFFQVGHGQSELRIAFEECAPPGDVRGRQFVIL